LIENLTKFSGRQINQINTSKGIPEPLKCAYPEQKICLSTYSVLNYRKIQDIPTSMYSNYSNPFLMERSGAFHASSRSTGLSPGYSNSFEAFGPPVQSPEKMESMNPVNESYTSFTATPRESVEGLSPAPAIKNSFGNIQTTEKLPQLSPLKTAKAFTWWEKLAQKNNSPSPPKSAGYLDDTKSKPSFLERIISKNFDTIVESNNLDLNTRLDHQQSDRKENIIYKDGHELHELILNDSKSVGIDEDAIEDEFADRFTMESDSTGDYSKSDISTLADGRSQIFSRTSRRSSGLRSPTKELFAKKKNDSMARERVKKTSKIECFLCYESFQDNLSTKFMCKSSIELTYDCHIQIHKECLPLIETKPCPCAFNEEKVSQSFFRVFTSILKNYRTFLMKPASINESQEDSNITNQYFQKEQFIADFDNESKVNLIFKAAIC
jgi:hypothetical protein